MKKILKIVGAVAGLAVVALAALPFLIDVNGFRQRIESELTSALGRDVTLGKLELSILSGSVAAQDLTIADDPAFSKEPFLRAKGLKVGVELLPLILSKEIHVTHLTIDHPEILLVQAASDKWNFSSIGGKNAGKAPTTKETTAATNPDLSVSRLNIEHGKVTVRKAHGRLHIYDDVNVAVKGFSFTSEFPFTLTANLPEGGRAKLDGKAGPINARDASETPLSATLDVKKLDIASSGFVDPATGLAGVADFDGTLSSDGRQAKTTGTLRVNGLKLSPKGSAATREVQLKYSVEHNLQKNSGTLSEGDIAVGNARSQLTGSYTMRGETTALNMKLDGQNMPVDELEAMLPALGVILPSGSSLKGGTLSTTLAITGPTNALVIAGPVHLSNSKLAGFDLGSKLSAVSALGGTQTGSDTTIRNLSTNARVAPEGIHTSNLDLDIPSLGRVTGDGTISPAGELNYKLNAVLGGVAGGLTQVAGFGGKAGIPILVQGTTSNPRFLPDVKGMVNSQLKSGLSGLMGGAGNTGGTGKSAADALGGLFGKKKKN